MASIYLGQFNGYNTDYGNYNSYFQYDEVTRNGTTITLTNCKLYFERVGSGYTTNRLAVSGSIAGQINFSNVTLNPSGTISPATMTYNIGTVNITGIDYTTDNISLSIQAKGTGGSSSWSSTSGTVQINYNGSISVPVINISEVSAPAGNIGGNVNISITRYNSTFVHNLYYRVQGDIAWEQIASNISTSYVWTIPTSLYNRIPNDKSLTIEILCYTYTAGYGSAVGTSTTSFVASVVNSDPEFDSSKLSYQDTNSSIVAKTSNNQLIVRNLSNLKITISSATAKNSATIVGYEVTFNNNTQTVQAGITDLGTVNLSQNTTLTVRAVDSRGNKTEATKTIIILDWVLPQALITAKRVNNFEDNTNIKANVTISSVQNINSIQSIKYRYKKTTDTNFSSDYTLQNNVNVVVSIDKLYAWNFQIEIIDKFGSTTYNFTVQKGVPIMFIDINLLSVGIGKFPTNLNSLDVDILNGKNFLDLMYPVGTVYQNATDNTSPATKFGGTWVQLSDRFLIGAGGSYSAGSTGGATSVTSGAGTSGSTTLTVDQIPSHRHDIPRGWGANTTSPLKIFADITLNYANNIETMQTAYTGGGQGHTHSTPNHTHTILNPYRAVYMWYRSA